VVGEAPSVATTMVGLVRFERLAARLAEPAALVRFRLSPLRGYGLLSVPTGLVGLLLQSSCGGAPNGATPLPVREFSPIEVRLIERLAGRMLAELAAAWAPVAPVDCSLVRVEANPLFAKIAAPEELVVHAELSVVTSRLTPATLSLVVPNAALDPIRPRLQAARAVDDGADPAPDAAWHAHLRERLLEVPVEVVVELGTTALTMARVLGLAVGDVIPLDTGRDAPVVARAGGSGRFAGLPGVQNGNNAVRISGRL
jgi:flagellar motor switch protein FliM